MTKGVKNVAVTVQHTCLPHKFAKHCLIRKYSLRGMAFYNFL